MRIPPYASRARRKESVPVSEGSLLTFKLAARGKQFIIRPVTAVLSKPPPRYTDKIPGRLPPPSPRYRTRVVLYFPSGFPRRDSYPDPIVLVLGFSSIYHRLTCNAELKRDAKGTRPSRLPSKHRGPIEKLRAPQRSQSELRSTGRKTDEQLATRGKRSLRFDEREVEGGIKEDGHNANRKLQNRNRSWSRNQREGKRNERETADLSTDNETPRARTQREGSERERRDMP